jgi:hypothetical protein
MATWRWEMRLRLRSGWLGRPGAVEPPPPKPQTSISVTFVKAPERLAKLKGELRGPHDIKIFVWRAPKKSDMPEQYLYSSL